MSLLPGCYLMSFLPVLNGNPDPDRACLGTLRVTGDSKTPPSLKASGDLYCLRGALPPSEAVRPDPDSDPAAAAMAGSQLNLLSKDGCISLSEGWKAHVATTPCKIPYFDAGAYRYYLDVQAIRGIGTSLLLEATAHEFDPAEKTLRQRGTMKISLKPAAKENAYAGCLMNGDEKRGEFYLEWINGNVRRATLRLFELSGNSPTKVKLPGLDVEAMNAAVAGLRAAGGTEPPPPDKGAPTGQRVPGWRDLFRGIGWDLRLSQPKNGDAVANPGAWTAYDLGEAGQRLRRDVDPADWTYDLLCVPKFDGPGYLGIMFDAETTDLNRRPRESAAVAAQQELTNNGKSVLFQDLLGGAPYYRTALHELGHAMNLPHNLRDRSVMNTTGLLLRLAVPASGTNAAVPLSFDIAWSFSAEDAEWLQHAPDIAVRPGGIPRRAVQSLRDVRPAPAPISLRNAPDMLLALKPVQDVFPFGAPIRLDYSLSNRGGTRRVPREISLRGGHVMGRVTGPDRVQRFFRTAFRCCDTADTGDRLTQLAANSSIESSMTVLRGIDGPLFPEAGAYEIEVEIRWDADDQTHRVAGRTQIAVEEPDPNDPAQVLAAAMILNEPAMMPALVQGLIERQGLRALSVALRSPTLAEHYLATALKCRKMGEARGIDWDDESKLGGTTTPVLLPLPEGARSSSGRQLPLAEPLSSAVAARSIVQTWREQDQLSDEEDPLHTAAPGRNLPDRVRITQFTPSDSTDLWLRRVQDFTAPKTSQPTTIA